MIKVLMSGNHPVNKGGMTSVINQILNHDWEQDGIRLYFIPTFIPGNPIKKVLFFTYSFLRIMWMFVFFKPDIVHMHMSYKGSFSRKYIIHKLCKLCRINDVIHLHGSEFKKWYRSVSNKKQGRIKDLLSNCNMVIVLGDEWKKIIHQIEPSANITVLHNSVIVPSQFAKWNDDQFQALYLGVLIPRKGVTDLIKAVKLISNTTEIKKFHLIIAGTGDDEVRLKEMVKAANLEEFISFAGWVSGDNKTQLLMSSQILVLPSYNEGLPISILEAASYGLPIVSTKVGDIASVVKDGKNGFLIHPGDIVRLGESIIMLSDKNRWYEFSKNSKKIAVDKFSENTFIAGLTIIWNSLIRPV